MVSKQWHLAAGFVPREDVKRSRSDQNIVALDRYRKAPDKHWASIIEALLKFDLPADELSDRGE